MPFSPYCIPPCRIKAFQMCFFIGMPLACADLSTVGAIINDALPDGNREHGSETRIPLSYPMSQKRGRYVLYLNTPLSL